MTTALLAAARRVIAKASYFSQDISDLQDEVDAFQPPDHKLALVMYLALRRARRFIAAPTSGVDRKLVLAEADEALEAAQPLILGVGGTGEGDPGYASRASADTWVAKHEERGVDWNAESHGGIVSGRAQASSGAPSPVAPTNEPLSRVVPGPLPATTHALDGHAEGVAPTWCDACGSFNCREESRA